MVRPEVLESAAFNTGGVMRSLRWWIMPKSLAFKAAITARCMAHSSIWFIEQVVP